MQPSYDEGFWCLFCIREDSALRLQREIGGYLLVDGDRFVVADWTNALAFRTEEQLDQLAPKGFNEIPGQEANILRWNKTTQDLLSGAAVGCTECGHAVYPVDIYFSTPCGTYCSGCMPDHLKECEDCRIEFEHEL